MVATKRSTRESFQKVIRDPVHNLIELSGAEGELLLKLIDRPEFQRLRRIRQIGLGFLTYPGAEHSRWAHSVGVCHVARRMLDALQQRYGNKTKEGRELKRLRREILVAALLHDVGHGPFSHVFERAIPKPVNPPEDYPKKHEGWSRRIILERFGETLKSHDVDPEAVAGLLDKDNRQNPLAKDIISSQLDADRLDYLRRDSQAIGTRYGDFDLEWLLHSIRIGDVKVKGKRGAVQRLCFHGGKAVHVVEEYIQAREFMYLQVYTHKTTRAHEAMLIHVLGLASDIANSEPENTPQPCPPALAKMLARQPVSTEEYLTLDDFRLWSTLLDWSMQENDDQRLKRLRTLCGRLINRGRPYRVIQFDVRLINEPERLNRAIALQAEIKSQSERNSLYLDSFEDLPYRSIFYRSNEGDEEQEDKAIFFVNDKGVTQAAEFESEVIRAISGIKMQAHRLYFDETDEAICKRLKDEELMSGAEQESQGDAA